MAAIWSDRLGYRDDRPICHTRYLMCSQFRKRPLLDQHITANVRTAPRWPDVFAYYLASKISWDSISIITELLRPSLRE